MRKIRLKSPLNARLAAHLERELNDSQRQAATAPDGYNLILAGPGSGKTRVITYRVAHLIASGVPRIDHAGHVHPPRRPGDGEADGIACRTAGGAGLGGDLSPYWKSRASPRRRPLGYQANFTILDSEDQLDLIKLAMDDAKLTGTGSLPQGRSGPPSDQLCANVNRPLGHSSPTGAPT